MKTRRRRSAQVERRKWKRLQVLGAVDEVAAKAAGECAAGAVVRLGTTRSRHAEVSDATTRWVLIEVLASHLPAGFHIWVLHEGETRGVHRASNARAIATGLRFRSIETTTCDTLAWFQSLPPERRQRLFAGAAGMLSPEKEAELIAASKA